jgi:ribosomal protein L37E
MISEQELLEKFKKVMRMSNRVKQDHVAKMMDITHDTLLKLLFKWGDDLDFKIEEDLIVVEDLSQFVSGIDALFFDWERKEALHIGKIEDTSLFGLADGESYIDPDQSPSRDDYGGLVGISNDIYETIICTHCGWQYSSHLKECSMCGEPTPLESEISCPHCGWKYSSKQKACPMCKQMSPLESGISCPRCGWQYSTKQKACPMCKEPSPLESEKS